MQENYSAKHDKNSSKFLPFINAKKPKHIDAAWVKMKQPTQQSLLLQIQDIDSSLSNKKFSCHQGHLFSSQLTDKLIGDLHSCMKKQTSVMEDGFCLWNNNISARDNNNNKAHSQSKRLTNKISTLNEKLVNLSIQNVYEYELRKYMQIMKSNKSRWSLYKRLQNNPQHSKLQNNPQISKIISAAQSHEQSQTTTQRKPSSSINAPSIRQSSASINSYHINKNGESPTKSQQTTLSHILKASRPLVNQSQNFSKIAMGRHKRDSKRKILTQISQIESPEDQSTQISKYDVKNMLKKQSDHLIFIWLPPSAYPQFNGMFTYVGTRKIAIMRLKKYFFFRRSLSHRFFNSIIDEISTREDRYIESIQLTTNKNDYTKIFEPLGWKMKSLQGMDKYRIRYNRQTQ